MRPSGRFFLEQTKMITITNPETGTKHRIDADAAQEISNALHRSGGGEQIVFRAMRLDKAVALSIVNTCGFDLKTPTAKPTMGEMIDEDNEVSLHKAREEIAKETAPK